MATGDSEKAKAFFDMDTGPLFDKINESREIFNKKHPNAREYKSNSRIFLDACCTFLDALMKACDEEDGVIRVAYMDRDELAHGIKLALGRDLKRGMDNIPGITRKLGGRKPRISPLITDIKYAWQHFLWHDLEYGDKMLFFTHINDNHARSTIYAALKVMFP